MKKICKIHALFAFIMTSVLCLSFAAGAAAYICHEEAGVVVVKPDKFGTVIETEDIKSRDTSLAGDDIESRMTVKHVIVEEGITEIEHQAFAGLGELETISLPNTLTRIDYLAFANCTSLKNFILPSSVTWVEYEAFENCTSLTKVYYEGEANLDLPGHAAVPGRIDRLSVYPVDDGVSLSWNDTDYADYYRIYRWDYSKKQWTKIVDQEANRQEGWQSYKYPCKTVSGEKYRFAVRPVNVNGSDTKWNDFTAAEAVYLIPLKLKATALTGGYKLTWNKVPGAMGYQIWYSTKVNGTYKRYKNAYTESFTKTGLKKGTTYYFKVRPVVELSNGTYQVGEFSAPVKVTVK